MTVKHLYPNSRPSLDLKFAKNKVLDLRITYSRSSIGTYFDSTGTLQSAAAHQARFDHDPVTGESLGLLVEEPRTNSQTYSSDFTQATWTKLNAIVVPNATTAPDGTLTASKLVEAATTGGHHLENSSNNATTGLTWTLSFYVKAAERTQVLIWFSAEPYASEYFDLSTGTKVTNNMGSNSSITAISNGWHRISITDALSNNRKPFIATAVNGSNSTVGDGVSGIYLWGAQLEAGSFPTSYIPTPATFVSRADSTQGASYYDANGIIQYTALGAARDNAYFPDENGVMRPAGLLLEAAGTNLLTRSQELDNGLSWAGTGPYNVILANQTTAPDGTATAEKIASAAPTTENINLIQSYSATAGTTYTMSCFFKAGEATSCGVGYNVAQNSFNLSTGTANTPSAGTTSSITKLGNGWYRCSMTWTETTTTTRTAFVAAYGVPTGSSGGLFAWGAQLETGSYATSYIPTDGTPGGVTRAADVSTSPAGGVQRTADVAQITGANFSSWYNGNLGSFVATCDYKRDAVYNMIAEGVGGGTLRDFSLGVVAGNPNFTTRYSYTALDLVPAGGPIPDDTSFKLAGAYSSSGSAAVFNGGDVKTTGVAPAVSTPADSMTIGYRTGGVLYLNGHISRLTYYPVRLPDVTLQTFTS